MVLRIALDMDYLAANVHGRRSRLAEAERLDELCRLRTLADLAHHLFPGEQLLSVTELERRLILDLVEELTGLAARVGGAPADLLVGLWVRFLVENLKVLARGLAGGIALADLEAYLVPMPERLALPTEALASAESVEAFAALVSEPVLRRGVEQAAPLYKERPRAFFIECGLDVGYLEGLLARAADLPASEREDVLGIARHEADTFMVMLAARGRFHYRLPAEALQPFFVAHARTDRARFEKMLSAETPAEVGRLAVGAALERAPGEGESADAAEVEALAWDQHYRVANRCFRRSHMGLGAVVAYAAIRRIELANLIRLTEGIRAGLEPSALRRRLIPRRGAERARV